MFHVEQLEVKDAGIGVRKRDRVTALRSMADSGEKGQVAGGIDSRDGRGKGGLNIVDGAHGDDVEALGLGHRFHAVRPDFSGEMEGSNSFAEEGGFLVLGFGEGDMEFGAEESNWNARETGS